VKPIGRITKKQAERLSFILTDIDDTLTINGKLIPEAFSAIWKLNNKGFRVIPVTGRPAGWCDHIARFWPVAGVIGENGAFAFFMNHGKMERLYHPEADLEKNSARLEDVKRKVLRCVPAARIAEDQFCRLFDLAIDYSEQAPPLDIKEAEKIQRACELEGARAKISSIHVNAWFGSYDKLSMTMVFFHAMYPQCRLKDEAMFVGDSPNDEPMFSFFPLSCGVSNIEPYFGNMKVKPAFITEKKGGYGFAELTDTILRLRRM